MPTITHILPGYSATEILYETESTVVYRGYRESDQTPVVIKLLKTEYPPFREIIRLRHEYGITYPLKIAGVVKPYTLVEHGNSLALVLEDFGGVSLKHFIETHKIELQDFLPIAIQLAHILNELHAQNVIHKDIKPHNIIFNAATQQVKLTDFSVASLLLRENPRSSNPESLEGTLSYMSPEQTGRMNRGIDYRTDFYSLGVTFYEMLSGQLPFQSSDSMELVHSHIAKIPTPLVKIAPQVPQVVSDLVMKLLAKTAEDRYQNAHGLAADLEHCLEQLQTTGAIAPFPLGRQDQWGQFHIPEKLYGREKEVELLLAAFSRICEGRPELMLVGGYSGIGKSALVNEVHKPIVRQRGYFISGKFDQFKRNVPYSSLVQAFQELIRQLLTESEAQVARWRQLLTAALGSNGQVIVDVIPEVELIIGKQPTVPQMGATESQNRFNLMFRKFIHVFAKPEHPLVIFLDDLQWADLASINLIQLLMSDPGSQCLLIISAYRDNEVNATHPLMMMVETLTQGKTPIQTIALHNLNAVHINQLIADTLHSDLESVEPLTQLILSKTQGNPFFLTQLLKSLYQDQLLQFSFQNGCWQWDIAQIQMCSITDNVVEFMIGKIQKLPVKTQDALKLAACVGNVFSLQTLATVQETSLKAIALDLWPAVQDGLIVPLDEAYKVLLTHQLEELNAAIAPDVVITYRFLHDRVQQAAYALIPDEKKQETHLKVGQLLLQNTPLEAREEKLFDIVNALNIGVELITDPTERERLAQLNLAAGQKAKAASAYQAALEYFTAGMSQLTDQCWQQQYDLTLALYLETAEVTYLVTDYEKSQALVSVIEQRANSRLDKVKAYELRIQFHMALLQMLKAIAAGLEALDMLEISLLSAPEQSSDSLTAGDRWLHLPELDELANVPEMTNPVYLAALNLLRTVTSPAYQAQPQTFQSLALTQTSLCIQHGHSAPAAFAYVAYGWLMCGRLGKVDVGYQAGQIALALLEQFNAKALKCSVYQIFETFIRPWKEHIRATFEPLIEAIQVGQETGDISHVSFCIMNYCTHLFLSGEHLEVLDQKQLQYIELLEKFKQDSQIYYTQILRQLTLNLRNPDSQENRLIGESFDEVSMLPYLKSADNHQLLFDVYVAKLILGFLFKDYAEAAENAEIAQNYVDSGAGLALSGAYCFYRALNALALCFQLSPEQRYLCLNIIQEERRKIQDWAYHAPANYQHKLDLINAELARLNGQIVEAMNEYDHAIQRARENRYLQEEAIANERAAEFYLAINKERIAQAYLTDAYYGYVRWGAIAKVQALEAQYPQLLNPVMLRERSGSTTHRSTHSSTQRHAKMLDITTVIKASQALSSEIVLDSLLDQFIRLVIENAGAQRCFFITHQNGVWSIEAEGDVDADEVVVLESTPLLSSQKLPVSVVNYVARTQENLVLEDAVNEEKFFTDSYIATVQPRSILCFPILRKGVLNSILYLENNLTTGAFTEERLELLKVLMAQISISIENATLYTNLQTYSRQLEANSQELELKNQALQLSEIREREKAQELQRSLLQLKQTQAQLVQTEKISSLGQLVAGVAHEVNNPVGFIAGNLNYAQQYCQDLVDLLTLYRKYLPDPPSEVQDKVEEVDLDYLLEDLPKMLSSMQIGTDRIRQIMSSLRTFSRVDAVEKQPANLHEGIDSTLLILQHRLKAKPERPAIQLVKRYGDLPLVACYAGQLNQVFMNLIANAIDALDEYNGTRSYEEIEANPNVIIIRTEVCGDRALVSIGDNGPGIPPEAQNRLFEAFFTTKDAAKGTGLGLSISYQIVTEKHGGQLSCRSSAGEGTEFMIEIPLG